jgi:polyisoprenoid-binding protein YceI
MSALLRNFIPPAIPRPAPRDDVRLSGSKGRGLANLCAAVLLLACGTAGAEVWPIDGARSHAQFSVRTLWFTHERGEFKTMYGELRNIDHERDVVDASIDARSLDMDDEDALQEARGPAFFDVDKYPRIHFTSAPFPATALRDGGTLDGTLELHGQRREVRFELDSSQCPEHPLQCSVRVRGRLSRSAFGMRAHRGWLSDRVSLDLEIVLAPPVAPR